MCTLYAECAVLYKPIAEKISFVIILLLTPLHMYSGTITPISWHRGPDGHLVEARRPSGQIYFFLQPPSPPLGPVAPFPTLLDL